MFQEKLAEYGMVCSMSRQGNCWDNAPTESFFNSLKNERVHGTRYPTREEAIHVSNNTVLNGLNGMEPE